MRQIIGETLLAAARHVTALWEEHEPDAAAHPVRVHWGSKGSPLLEISTWHRGGRFCRQIPAAPLGSANPDGVLVDGRDLIRALLKMGANSHTMAVRRTTEGLTLSTDHDSELVTAVADSRELPEWGTAHARLHRSGSIPAAHLKHMFRQTRHWGVRQRATPLHLSVNTNGALIVWRGSGNNSLWAVSSPSEKMSHIEQHFDVQASMAVFLAHMMAQTIGNVTWEIVTSQDFDGHQTGRGRIHLGTHQDAVWIPIESHATNKTPWATTGRTLHLGSVRSDDLRTALPEVISSDAPHVDATIDGGDLILTSHEDDGCVRLPVLGGVQEPDRGLTTTLNLALLDRLLAKNAMVDLYRDARGITAQCGVMSTRLADWPDSGQ